MRIKGLSIFGIFALAFVLAAGNGIAEGDEAGKASAAKANAKAKDPAASASVARAPVYVPPRRGQPRARIGGGVRGPAGKLPTLQAFVPEHVAHTGRSQPTLLWHMDVMPPENASLMFKLTNDYEIDPLVAEALDRPSEAGVQRIDMSKYDFDLEVGMEYQWSVALVPDSERRSKDVVVLGWIERVEDAGQPASDADVAALAAAGLWYDAIDVADDAERDSLLGQIGLAATGNP